MNAATWPAPAARMVRSSSAACRAPQPTGWVSGNGQRYSYGVLVCLAAPSQGRYGARRPARPDTSSAARVLPWYEPCRETTTCRSSPRARW